MFKEVVETNKMPKILTTPADTTGKIQPLDVLFFRPWKNFLRHFSDIVVLHNYDKNLHLQNNIIQLQSIIHNQFSSPRFLNLVRYAWYKSGYLQNKLEFENLVDYCFKSYAPACGLCDDIAVIRCAWCTKSLCMTHLFKNYHYCKSYC